MAMGLLRHFKTDLKPIKGSVLLLGAYVVYTHSLKLRIRID